MRRNVVFLAQNNGKTMKMRQKTRFLAHFRLRIVGEEGIDDSDVQLQDTGNLLVSGVIVEAQKFGEFRLHLPG